MPEYLSSYRSAATRGRSCGTAPTTAAACSVVSWPLLSQYTLVASVDRVRHTSKKQVTETDSWLRFERVCGGVIKVAP